MFYFCRLMITADDRLDRIAELSVLEQDLKFESTSSIPGGVHYKIKRYSRPGDWMSEDLGMINYRVQPSEPEKNHLELRFCIAGNMYCPQDADCKHCKQHQVYNCRETVKTIDFLSFVFTKEHLLQFSRPKQDNTRLSDEVLSFEYNSSFSKTVPVCNKTRSVIDGLLNNGYSDTLQNIYINAQTQMLLLYSMDCMVGEKEIDTITCKFLANENDRDKIARAREILIEQIGEPITIKELSRKVAINECYLKKGFKEMYGTTIFDFYQNQRMEHAKYLLYEKGMSVTDVSALLGYSSISHFSTAFKKHTGIKPCELLFR